MQPPAASPGAANRPNCRGAQTVPSWPAPLGCKHGLAGQRSGRKYRHRGCPGWPRRACTSSWCSARAAVRPPHADIGPGPGSWGQPSLGGQTTPHRPAPLPAARPERAPRGPDTAGTSPSPEPAPAPQSRQTAPHGPTRDSGQAARTRRIHRCCSGPELGQTRPWPAAPVPGTGHTQRARPTADPII